MEQISPDQLDHFGVYGRSPRPLQLRNGFFWVQIAPMRVSSYSGPNTGFRQEQGSVDPARSAEHATQMIEPQYDAQAMTVPDLNPRARRRSQQLELLATFLLDPSGNPTERYVSRHAFDA